MEELRLGRDGPPAPEGMIADPASKSKSVMLTDEGLHEAEALFRAWFARTG